MDNIEKLLKEIKNDNSIWRHKGEEIRFSSHFLKTVGEIFERKGFGEAKVHLMNLINRNRPDAMKILRVIKKFERTPEIVTKRSLGKAIITSLPTLKRMEV